jgi:predicted CoA-binding protein
MSDRIDDFLSRRRIAIVGVSHEPKEFSRMVFRAFRERGYDVVPVNPHLRVVEEIYCFPRVLDVQPPVETALILTPPAVSEHIAQNCVEAGIRQIWLYRKCPGAEAACAAAGVSLIVGECPLMYLERPGFIHRVHGWFHTRPKYAATSGML